ncbi:serine/threonine protein kinase [Microcoleus sp. FACHB-1515]|uniref:serine/threonine-protein kinase n=1 Tax=Cyanophyceae TaxID=3028117 RepID=UPI001686837C|nr:serine/threonine-protein kinase [Microcoleus sp. FACHB-1515]MBD2089561.1 serine/threonine protein kinase [Microcoleus sp. FACHB-1515]
MEVYCTRPGCPRPVNQFADLDDKETRQRVQQKFCTTCGMPLILVGHYIPQKLLGKGGFGAAFLGRDRYTPSMRYCVVKQFQPAADLSPQQLQVAQSLFEREGEVLEQLGNKHPQIPDLFSFFELDVPSMGGGKPTRYFYLVQEFIDGKNLEEELAAKGKFSEAEVQEVLTETLKVLQYVHDNGSIHRDIKPSNIMRHRNGRLYLLDFGAVKQKVAQGVGSPGKSTGIYTQWYAAPEQMRGNEVYPSSDLYALAVTCIALLTGKEPEDLFDSYNNRWSWRQYAQVSDRLEAVLNRMLQPNPGDRFASANDVLAALTTPTPPPTAPPTQVPVSPPVVSPPPISPPGTPPQPPISPPVASPPQFSTLELLGNAAFTGFEGGLLGIAALSVLGTTLIGSGFWLVLLGALVFLQNRRTIEGKDFLIISAITLAVVWFVPALRDVVSANAAGVVVIAAMAGLVAIAIMAVFQIIYKLLSRIL